MSALKRGLPALGLCCLLLGSSAWAQSPALPLPRSVRTLSFVPPGISGSANPMNLSAWSTLLGAVLGVGAGFAMALEQPGALPVLVLGGALLLVGPSLSYFVSGEGMSGLVQLGLRAAAAALLAGGLLWGIAAEGGAVAFVAGGVGGLALGGLTLFALFDSEHAGNREPVALVPALIGGRHRAPGLALSLRF